MASSRSLTCNRNHAVRRYITISSHPHGNSRAKSHATCLDDDAVMVQAAPVLLSEKRADLIRIWWSSRGLNSTVESQNQRSPELAARVPPVPNTPGTRRHRHPLDRHLLQLADSPRRAPARCRPVSGVDNTGPRTEDSSDRKRLTSYSRPWMAEADYETYT